MQALSTLLSLDKSVKQAAYLQIANQLMVLIRKGTLPPGYRLLSTRQLAGLLNVHRRTVVQAYDELLAQGWLESHLGSGTFVAKNLPEIQLVKALPGTGEPVPDKDAGTSSIGKYAGFTFERPAHLNRPVLKSGTRLHLDDGFPDPRLAPLDDLSRAYRSQLLHGNSYVKLGYGDTRGSAWLRQELAGYLSETRGLNVTDRNILIVRGVIMGIHLVATTLVRAGDRVAVDATGWFSANMNFVQAGAKVLHVPVDEFGIDTEAMEKLCQEAPIRLLYVTSHHHYPTTVALRADRRIKLLKLAEKYGFVIFEDDYDYDFHYLSKPLLPLAGADRAGMVLYCGSFTKAISPAFRVGYLVGPEDFIEQLAHLRRIIDRQGDQMLENAFAELLHNGVIQRHLRKSVRVYKQRRDFFCDQLHAHLGGKVEFQVPDGGMAVWTKFNADIDLARLAARALKKDLYFADGAGNLPGNPHPNSVRLGFASSNFQELEESVRIIEDLL